MRFMTPGVFTQQIQVQVPTEDKSMQRMVFELPPTRWAVVTMENGESISIPMEAYREAEVVSRVLNDFVTQFGHYPANLAVVRSGGKLGIVVAADGGLTPAKAQTLEEWMEGK